MRKESLCAVTFLGCSLFAWSTAGQCKRLTNADEWDKWTIPEDLADLMPTVHTASNGKLEFVRQTLEEWADKMARIHGKLLDDRSRFPSLPSDRLTQFIEQVLHDFDGTDKSARWLRADDIRPKPCATKTNEDGLSDAVCAWTVLSEPPVDVPNEGDPGVWRCEDQNRFGAYVRVIWITLESMGQKMVDKAVDSLKTYRDRWNSLIRNGYSQYPWEVLINGLFLEESSWGPTNFQGIWGHLSAGFGVLNLSEQHDSAAAPAIVTAVELGILRYFSNHKQFAGVSTTFTISNLRWGERGVGAVLHFSGIHVGYSCGIADANWGEHTVFLLIDVTKPIDDSLLQKKVPTLLNKLF